MENNYILSNKCALFYTMKRYYEAIGRDPYEVIPLTFHIKNNTEDPEFYKFQTFFKELESAIPIGISKIKGQTGNSSSKKERKENLKGNQYFSNRSRKRSSQQVSQLY